MLDLAEVIRRVEQLEARGLGLNQRLHRRGADSVGHGRKHGDEDHLTAGGGGSALTVQEIDGAPLDAAVAIIRVPNGTLTVNAAGDVTLDVATDAELAAHAADADPHTVYVLEGATPGGELGGTYAVPTVDATHSGSAHHAAVTIAADADAVLSLTGQDIGLDTQNANRVFAGPASGGPADPTFRALVAADVPIVAIGGELNAQTQGADKLIIPVPKSFTAQKVVIFFLNVPTVAHSFSFFLSGAGTPFAAVTKVTTAGVRWNETASSQAFTGLTDWISVRHDTTAQDADEGVHVDEGGRLWAFVLGA